MLKISCVVGVYGRNSMLSELLSCFLQQDYSNKKLIIINQHEQPIKLNHQDVLVLNKDKTELNTMPKIRQACIDVCSGDLIRLLDVDDLFLPWHLSDYVNNLGSDDLGLKGAKMFTSTDNSNYSIVNRILEPNYLFRKAFVNSEKANSEVNSRVHSIFTIGRTDSTIKTYTPLNQNISYIYRKFNRQPHMSILGGEDRIAKYRANCTDTSEIQFVNMYETRWKFMLEDLQRNLPPTGDKEFKEFKDKVTSYNNA